MKKLTILTSLLALTACGGGSGGGAGTPDLTVRESNANVTGMDSFVVIGGANPTINANARSAKMGILQEDGGTRYDLENVTFKSIPTSGVIADLKFHTDDNGKIVSVEYPDAVKIMEEHSGSDVTVGPLERKGDTNIFVEHVVLDEEFGDRAGQKVDIPNEYISYAKEIGLKYSDFGIVKMDLSKTGVPEFENIVDWSTPFAGGYNVKKVDGSAMKDLAQKGDIVFSGLAKGQVSYHDWNATIGDRPLAGGLTDKKATLTFAKDGTQTLAADFKNWAKIEAVKAPDGTNQFIIRESYVANDSPYYIGTSPSGLPDGVMDEHTMVMQTGYYGDNGKPIEGVGLVQYQHQWGDPHYVESEKRWDIENHVNVDLGFGGIKKQK